MGVRVGDVGVRVGDVGVRVQVGQLSDELPHVYASRVRVAMRPAHHLRVSPYRESVEDNPTGSVIACRTTVSASLVPNSVDSTM